MSERAIKGVGPQNGHLALYISSHQPTRERNSGKFHKKVRILLRGCLTLRGIKWGRSITRLDGCPIVMNIHSTITTPHTL